MNEIKYNILTDTSTKRTITILNLLLESNNDPLPLSELSKICAVTKKTLRRDIHYLTGLFPGKLLIDNSTVSFQQPIDRIQVLNFINERLDNSILCSITKDIFYGKSESIDFLTEKTFTSESTLRKHLSLLKEVLEDFNLTLNYSPVEITGNEIDIRCFYFKFFENSTKYTNVYPPKKMTELYNMLRKLHYDCDINLNLDLHRFTKWLFIIEQRVKIKKFVCLDENIFTKYSKLDIFDIIKEATNRIFSKNFPFPIPESEILFSALISLDTVLFDEKSQYITQALPNAIEQFEAVSTEFFNRTPFNYSLNIELKAIFKSYLFNQVVLQDLSCLFQKNNSKFNELIKMQHSETYDIWKYIIDKHTNFKHPKDIAVSLTALTEAKVNKSRKILIAFTGNSAETSYYKYLVQKHIPVSTKSFFIFNQAVDNDLIERLDIDFCICNFPLTNPDDLRCPVFNLTSIPAKSEWENLSKILH